MTISIDFKDQTGKLANAISSRLAAKGEVLAKSTYESAALSLAWLEYLRTYEMTGHCDSHLDGWRAAIVETLGCIAMGLVRPGIFALRTQIDLALAWLYFKDHPVEWARVEERGEGFMLKSDVIAYLESFLSNYRGRYSALLSGKSRKEGEPYRLLSAHVHAQSSLVVPTVTGLLTMVQEIKRCQEAIQLQFEVSEYLSDVFLAFFGTKWSALPQAVLDNVAKRLGKDAHKAFQA